MDRRVVYKRFPKQAEAAIVEDFSSRSPARLVTDDLPSHVDSLKSTKHHHCKHLLQPCAWLEAGSHVNQIILRDLARRHWDLNTSCKHGTGIVKTRHALWCYE